MGKYIIFKAEEATHDQNLQMGFKHTNAWTNILQESWSFSGKPIPQPGDRPSELVRQSESVDPNRPQASTHSKLSDWEVVRVQTYTPDIPPPQGAEYDMIVICYCRYRPINAPLKSLALPTVTVDSFGGDVEAYQNWLAAQKIPTEV